MATNADGWVGMMYYQPNQQYVRVGGDKNFREYVFVVHRDIAFAWVHPADVENILSIKKTCCGGSNNPVYRIANDQAVRIWSGEAER